MQPQRLAVFEFNGPTVYSWNGTLRAGRLPDWTKQVECPTLPDLLAQFTGLRAGVLAEAAAIVMYDGPDAVLGSIEGGIHRPRYVQPALSTEEVERALLAAGASSVTFKPTLELERSGLGTFDDRCVAPVEGLCDDAPFTLPDRFCYFVMGGVETRVVRVEPGEPGAYRTDRHSLFSHLGFQGRIPAPEGSADVDAPKAGLVQRTDLAVQRADQDANVLNECRWLRARIVQALLAPVNESGARAIVLAGVGPSLIKHLLFAWRAEFGPRGEGIADSVPMTSHEGLVKAILAGRVRLLTASKSAPLLGAVAFMSQMRG